MTDQWTRGDNSIFGGWLPYIGWRTIAFDDDGYPVDPTEDDFDPNAKYEERSVFCLAWFNWCVLIDKRLMRR